MLIRFTVENYKSFDKEAVFSMIPGKAQKHPNHIIESDQPNGVDVLKTALLYGANASGKSNLIQAMAFARDFIVDGVRPKAKISVVPFKLDNKRRKEPSKFEFEFTVDRKAYAYGFSIDRERVYEEWLYAVDSEDEIQLFERKTNPELQTVVDFSETIGVNSDDLQFLNYVARSTRYNQLFLTKSAEDQIKTFDKFHEWFNRVLHFIFPNSHHEHAEADILLGDGYQNALSQFLSEMNTGIKDVYLQKLDFTHDEVQNGESSRINDFVAEHGAAILDGPGKRRRYARQNEDGEPEIYELKTRHYNTRVDNTRVDNTSVADVLFDMSEESDGTKRLVDLFPILYAETGRVVIIDELERSLHPNLAKKFLEQYLAHNRSGQLIVSTHESTLLDLDLLRRDEIWFVEKDQNGNSTLYSLEEFKPRADLDIRKGYLHGRYGAIPIIGSSLNLTNELAHAA